MKALRIPADSEPVQPIETVEWDGSLEAIQALVGGYIETVPFTDDVAPFFDEEGKLKGLAVNSRATMVIKARLASLGRMLGPGDVLVGDVFLTGQNSQTGEAADLPDWVRHSLDGLEGA